MKSLNKIVLHLHMLLVDISTSGTSMLPPAQNIFDKQFLKLDALA
jgi:hypothetical protein